ncbi:glycosyltransferase family 4 protein [Sulfuriferula nivalis]|uniref:Capsular polysaccharide glycosyltransferase biosynthesis protein n=1 Tax=Sulfuriferula nivalis TaxID=2675298 RepID=A0A809S2A4_9PROT|nr:glycosyltransferase family 1 protein [Sulfuriferula nivalis]BBP00768.1 capsular polysaccharide glycosyltransferase biosynthesis protein [Sulfuriferula nivalis]
MKILIDVTRLVSRFMDGRLPTGVDRVGLAYVQHFGAQAQAVVRWAGRLWVLPRAQSAALFAWLAAPVQPRGAVWIVARGILAGGWLQDVAGYILLNTGHTGLHEDAYVAMLRKLGVRPVFVVHDLIPITHPEYCRAGEDVKHRQRMRHVLSLGYGVVANSQATLDDLSQFAAQSQLPMPPAVVGLLAPGPAHCVASTCPVDAPYFVVLSTIEPRKNHVLLLQVWRRLVEQFGEHAPRLVVIGQRGWECENVVDLLERCAVLKGFVIELADCPDEMLVTYLHHARALLFPSFVEGYGMPLVEALALGVPVIASDLAVFHEIAADIPEYIDPLDGLRWAERVMDYAQPNSESRAAQLQRISHFKTPSWGEHFVKVDGLLARLGEG